MNQVLGLGVTGLSVMIAAVVSGLRLRPYLDAGERYTPLTFAFYPALIAAAIAVPVVLILRKWQGKTDVDLGPVTLPGNMPFITLGCLLYVIVAVAFFPYQEPRPRPPKPDEVRTAVGYEEGAGRPLRGRVPLRGDLSPVVELLPDELFET